MSDLAPTRLEGLDEPQEGPGFLALAAAAALLTLEQTRPRAQ